MSRLSLLLGFFLSVTMSIIISVLALVAKVTWATLVFRGLTAFFLFGFLGVVLGGVLEVIMVPLGKKLEEDQVKKELELEDKTIEQDLGDLLIPTKEGDSEGGSELDFGSRSSSPGREDAFKPAVFPRLSEKNGRAISRGDSTVVS